MTISLADIDFSSLSLTGLAAPKPSKEPKERKHLSGETHPFTPRTSYTNLTPPRHECRRAGPDDVAPDLLTRLVKSQRLARIESYTARFLLNILSA